MADETSDQPDDGYDRAALIRQMQRINKLAPRMARPEGMPKLLPTTTKVTARTDFATLEVYQEMTTHKSVADLIGLHNPYFQVHEGRAGSTTRIDGRDYLNFASYDYLGLNAAPSVAAAAKSAIDTYGTSVSASRPTAGDRPLHRRLERQIADLYQAEAALTFVSGHATNVSTIGDLLGPADCVLYDAFCHNSIAMGAKLSGAVRRRFAHNDLQELERILAETRDQYDRVMIVVEGLYSMDGDVPDLARLITLKKRYEAWLMVDDAHALGVLGERGFGLFEHAGVDPRSVDIWMGTLSKTLSGCGGYIAGSKVLIDILKFHAGGFMFSVGMSPPVAAAASAALDLMIAEPERVARLQHNGRFFLQVAKARGLDTGLSAGFAVVPVIVGDSLRAVRLANLLMEKGIIAVPVTYPAVPMQAARLRFFITCEHDEAQLTAALDATASALSDLQAVNFGLGQILGERTER